MTDLIEKEENMMEEYTKEDCGREDEHKRRWKERKKLRKYDYGNPDSGTYYENRISCDYGPCGVIREAMKSSGADFSNPIKTTIWVGDGWISVSAGYAATPVYHYPISEDRYGLQIVEEMNDHLVTIEASAERRP